MSHVLSQRCVFRTKSVSLPQRLWHSRIPRIGLSCYHIQTLLTTVDVDVGSSRLVVISLILASLSRLGYNPLKFMKFTTKPILLKYTIERHFWKADSKSCVTNATISFQNLSPPKEFLCSLAYTLHSLHPKSIAVSNLGFYGNCVREDRFLKWFWLNY